MQDKAIEIINEKMQNELKPKQISVFYGDKEIEDGNGISMFNSCNSSARTTDVNYSCR